MADIVTRLLLKTNDFDANLAKSKSSVNKFQGGISDMAKMVRGGFLKVAGGIGLAVSAGEGLTKFLNSSQELGDMTARNMEALKGSVDEFFYSLGSGEFASFLSGLGDIIDKAKEAHGAIDQLGNTKISHSYFSAENEGEIAKAQYVAKNKFAPLEDRVKSFENWRAGLEAQADINKTLQADLIKAITTSVEAEIGAAKLNVTMDDVRMALKIDVTNPLKRDELKSQYSADYAEYQKKVSKLGSAYQHFDKNGNVSSDGKGEYRLMSQKEKANELGKLNEKYRDAIVVNAMLNKYEDDELTTIANMAIEYRKLDTALASTSREYNETANEFNNANKAVKGFTAVVSLEGYKTYSGNSATTRVGNKQPTPPPAGSIAEITEQIAAKNKELINATTAQARVAVQATIDELEAKKINLQIETNKGLFAEKYGENKLPNASTSEMAGIFHKKEEDKSKKGGKFPKFEPPINKKDVKLLEDYQESLYGISDTMRLLSGVTGEGAAAWLDWGASLLSSIAQGIPAIRDLILALQAKAAGEAVAGSAAAGPLGWISAGVALASILATFASIPAFAGGGVIEGGSTFGDMNLARVNAGEMILNGTQQGNLFRLLDGGSNSPSNSGGTVSFRIKGRDLEGVLLNYNNQKSKVR